MTEQSEGRSFRFPPNEMNINACLVLLYPPTTDPPTTDQPTTDPPTHRSTDAITIFKRLENSNAFTYRTQTQLLKCKALLLFEILSAKIQLFSALCDTRKIFCRVVLRYVYFQNIRGDKCTNY